jgi:uncharacterized protein YegL
MEGLQQWASMLRLRKRRAWWPWLLLLLPLLLLLYIPSCDDFSLLNMNLETQSFIFIIDRSGSMEEEIAYVSREMSVFLDNLIADSGYGTTYYGDIISYTNSAESALGGIREIDPTVAQQLRNYLTNLMAGGDTELRSAIDLATLEVLTHDKPTTLFIITDAHEDRTITEMIYSIDDVKSAFGSVDIHVKSTTPRIINATEPVTSTVNPGEEELKRFTELFEGDFGGIGKN